MSGAVVEMYIKNQIEHSIELGRLSEPLIDWIAANLPTIKDIHLTALCKNKDHITILFNDNSKVHWWYKSKQEFMLPFQFQGVKPDGTNYQAKTFMEESTIKVDATDVTHKKYLLTHLYDEMKTEKNIRLFGDVKDLDEYVGHLLPLLSSQELNPYGSCFEDDELLLHNREEEKEEDIRDRDKKKYIKGRLDDTSDIRGRGDRDGGKKFTRKSNKRKSNKRKSNKRKSNKRK